MSWRKYLLIPKLIAASRGAPKGDGAAWDQYWGGVRQTGISGEVLWDAGSEREIAASIARLHPFMDPQLPIVEVGCGNGTHTRALAARFPHALGIDISAHAIERAKAEAQHGGNVAYRVLDGTTPGAGQQLALELGEVNVYIRGVFHVLTPHQRERLVRNLRDMVGARGAVYLIETAYPGSPLDYLEHLGATSASIPPPLLNLIASGLRPPACFDARQFHACFPATHWETLAAGPATLHAIPLDNGAELLELPAFFAVARCRRRPAAEE